VRVRQKTKSANSAEPANSWNGIVEESGLKFDSLDQAAEAVTQVSCCIDIRILIFCRAGS